jgi:hypothetical protein
MKKAILSLIAGLAIAGTSFAGHEMVSSGKDYKDKNPVIEPCFKDQELQLDVFGSYTQFTTGHSKYQDGFGGGLGVNYFFCKYVGVGVDGNVLDGNANGVWTATGSVILRYPIDLGSFCFAPYVFGGGGGMWDGTAVGSGHAGGGLEYRIIKQKLGIYAEGRYTWTGNGEDNAQFRTGVRFVF